ncbi:Protein-N(5)-glutamine methyltransferase PrmC, methylates polypeptide chain release factors RF1 and RF2 [Marinobacterium lacunae]|uniref:Release factor glutamine methyltransferase n=1 Tax=Marinobacterium lacunae TaxID=1232683 RepID=A0A081G1F9_9GAMM|nr:peptide chain release factor N(5)-glutamine methyltransferase [Marinobacterium lacunae]KEA64614.1 Protein-N(5)-glutamine methyltransferase PrmC, methylates polypeptide chain release factors RF1 and RF2 [Marinobacterium lacunae]
MPTESAFSIQQALAEGINRIDSDSARLDTELLLCHVLGKPRSYLFTWPERELTAEQRQAFGELLARRIAGEPVAHLTGLRDFWTLTLEVTADTLIPRPDTETLVEAALERLGDGPYRVADLGTGTGAIALALASERPRWQVIATDRVPEAAELARRNRDRVELHNVEVLTGSWCEPLGGLFDMILSNPPYIDEHDPHLAEGDVRFEPRSALVADESGLSDIRQIAEQARNYLKPEGWLLFEHGYDQGEPVRALLAGLGYAQVTTLNDLGGRARVTLARMP